MRAETGPMRFAGDWRGIFIRGDNALGYAIEINVFLEAAPDHPYKHALKHFAELLMSADERQESPTQTMKAFSDCTEQENR